MNLDSIKNKAVSGFIWSFTDFISRQGISFVIQIILARLLLPEDFGIIGIVTIFIALSKKFIDSGFTKALIRENDSTQEDYSTVFYFNLGMAIIMCLILVFMSEWIAIFFNEPKLVLIIRVLSLSPVINSIGMLQRTMLIKKVDFKSQTRVNVTSSFISGAIAIAFAYKGFGVWSLVIKTLSMNILQTSILCYINKWKPSLVFNISSFKRLFGFGWKLLVSGLIDTLFSDIQMVIIGRYFSATQLGYYTNVRNLRNVILDSITSTVQKVSYPVLSKMQDEDTTLRQGYRTIAKGSVYLTFPMMIGLLAVADHLIRVLYGVNWISSVPYLRIICLAGMLYPLHVINLNILQVKGRSDLFLKLEIAKQCVGIVIIFIVLYFKLGVLGLLWGKVVHSFISLYINSYFSGKLLSYSTKDQIKDVMPIFIITLIMGVSVYVLGRIISISVFLLLPIQVLFGIFIYFILSKIFRLKELDTILNLLYKIKDKWNNARS